MPCVGNYVHAPGEAARAARERHSRKIAARQCLHWHALKKFLTSSFIAKTQHFFDGLSDPSPPAASLLPQPGGAPSIQTQNLNATCAG